MALVFDLGDYARVRKRWYLTNVHKLFLIAAGVTGATGVAMGAFGAHALRSRLDARALEVFETASRYHLLHAVAIAVVAFLCRDPAAERWGTIAGWLFIAGVAIFAGTLYTLAITGTKWLGAITPIGGLLLLAGWLAVAIAGFKAS